MQPHDQHNLSLYDVLELTPDATPQEIRSAYLRLKSAYGKDNIAHYTLFSREETEETLKQVETSYLILSNPEKRRAYDQAQGHGAAHASPYGAGIGHSFDGMMPNSDNNLSALAASGYGLDSHAGGPDSSALNTTSKPITTQPVKPTPAHLLFDSPIDVDEWIRSETEWGGAFLRRIREARRMTLEDLSDYTRISRSYLQALEEEQYNKLPALVYIRGFLQQVGKRLKLPLDTMIPKYMERIKSTRPDKA